VIQRADRIVVKSRYDKGRREVIAISNSGDALLEILMQLERTAVINY
jgi:hypothetical protein